MRDGWAWSFLFLALSSCVFAVEGTFQGKIVDPPGQKQAASGWIFVQGRNRMVRRVDVAHAVIVPAAGSWSGQGQKCGPECLAVGQEVRVTAEQDASGEWHARRVEILRPATGKGGYTIELAVCPAGPSAALPRHAGAGASRLAARSQPALSDPEPAKGVEWAARTARLTKLYLPKPGVAG